MPRAIALHSVRLPGARPTFLLLSSVRNARFRGFSNFLIPTEFSIPNWTIGRIVLVAVLSMLGCFGRAAEPLKIGMVSTLTGPSAETGRYETQGANLAAEEVN